MKIYKILLLAILTGIYSGVLDEMEYRLNLQPLVSNVILGVVVFITGFLLYKSGKGNN